MAFKKLHRLDLEIMKVIWELGQATVSEVLDTINRKLAYTTVATTMKHLEQKGFLTYTVDGRTFVYQPLIQEAEVSQSMLSDLLERFFDNSVERLVNTLLETEQIDSVELDLLQQLINRHKEGDTNE
ncbi:MAG: BlaI/MecI/CopY family transcriptional regulator [Candidatus Poribacteria bacterium]|nr:BlaI/MecI/CopY family transcriptional regulator [Candidatus Poribacteria bacterium]MEC9257230.1 BlaI/MecI/CopY family transcriptional regulator [Candidatus Poribacteria bacterium]